ncbi:MAG: hypothetical protein KJP21_08695 [Bacteroidia bacterium]|nr:hypothetical protein [Bacteroidia bacterium]NNJ56426.1 hypothetical protein [Bacteroidia bacterium]
MKKLILPLFCIILIFSCKDKNKTESHPESHTSTIEFEVSNEANIGSYNIYRNNDLIGQMASHSTSTLGEFRMVDLVSVTEHPANIKYTVEPVFYDSATANVDIAIKITVENNEVCSNPAANLKYGDVAEINCSID